MEIRKAAEEITRLEGMVRDHINTHRYQENLLKNSKTWNQICSSLDTIGDALYAIQSYTSEEYPEDIGLKYIYTYGILQALFIQQDGIRHLTEAFGLEFKISQELADIRNTRNASIGHPTKQDQKGTRYYNFISRVSMSKAGFDLLRSSENRPFEVVQADISAAIFEQLSAVIDGYEKIANWLEEVDHMHKEKYRSSPLLDSFPAAMGYFFEKIGQGIYARSYGDQKFGHANLCLVKETYHKFQAALIERNELSDHAAYDLKEYFHALARLDSYLSGTSSHMEEADARIYHSYIKTEHDHFVKLAREIDQQYQ